MTKTIGDEKRKREVEHAVEFVNSMRGKYILGQALHIAIEQLEQVKDIHREQSDIADMKFLRDNLFPLYSTVASINKKVFPVEKQG